MHHGRQQLGVGFKAVFVKLLVSRRAGPQLKRPGEVGRGVLATGKLFSGYHVALSLRPSCLEAAKPFHMLSHPAILRKFQPLLTGVMHANRSAAQM
jgi:hypothetical protein